MTLCSYHVTYAFQSESTLYNCLNVKELLARSRRYCLIFQKRKTRHENSYGNMEIWKYGNVRWFPAI